MNTEYNHFTCSKYNSLNCGNCQFKQVMLFGNAKNHGHNTKTHKAGIIYFNRLDNKLLVIQSRGNLWGIPKGTCKMTKI